MKYLAVVAGSVGVLFSLTGFAVPTAQAAPQHSDSSRAARMHRYRSEHEARLSRHAHLTPEQKHVRNLRYRREHQARQHRHRALVEAQHRHEG